MERGKLQRFSLHLCIILTPIHPFSMKSSSTAPSLAAAPRHYSCSLREAEEKHNGIYMESVQVITAARTAFTSRWAPGTRSTHVAHDYEWKRATTHHTGSPATCRLLPQHTVILPQLVTLRSAESTKQITATELLHNTSFPTELKCIGRRIIPRTTACEKKNSKWAQSHCCHRHWCIC